MKHRHEVIHSMQARWILKIWKHENIEIWKDEKDENIEILKYEAWHEKKGKRKGRERKEKETEGKQSK
jgi:hypothetical protein